MATKVDGIATLRLRRRAGDGAPLLEQATRKGFDLHHALTPAFPESEKEVCAPKGFGYVGAPNYAAGFSLGVEAGRKRGRPQGRRLACSSGV